jgi:3-phosphoshikimate 1-carboxyvinyltransferase
MQKTVLIFKVKGDFISKPYVDMTLDLMEKFRVYVDYERTEKSFHIEPQIYRSKDYTVEGDYSSASYLIAAAASINSDLTIQNLVMIQNRAINSYLDIVRIWVLRLKLKIMKLK